MTYIVLRVVFVEGGAVLHEDGSDDVRAMESDLDVVLVVQGHIG